MIFRVAPDRELVLGAALLDQLREYTQDGPEATEAGGLLLGRLSDNNHHLTLCQCTTPLPGDVREPRGFERNDPGHRAAVRRAWVASGGEVTCWGTWHTHAEPHPSPSDVDLDSWRADGRDLAADFFHVIVGTEEIGVWEVTRDGRVQKVEALA